MTDSIEWSVLEMLLTGLPNFAGFVILSYVMFKIITRQLDMLERIVVDCLEQDDVKNAENGYMVAKKTDSHSGVKLE